MARAAAIGTEPLRLQATRARPDLARATTRVAGTRVRNSTCDNPSRSRGLPPVTGEEVTEATTARRATPEVVAATVEADRTARPVPGAAIPRAEGAVVPIPPGVAAGTRVEVVVDIPAEVTTKPADAPGNFVRVWF